MNTVQPIKAGDVWTQVAFRPTKDGAAQAQVRAVEVIAAPTLSSPVGYRILRNDAHPHRVGKTASAQVSAFRRKYEQVRS